MKKSFLNSLIFVFLLLLPALCFALSANNEYRVEDCIPPETPVIQEPGEGTITGANTRSRIDTNQPTFTWAGVSDPSDTQPSDLWYEVQIDHDGSFFIADGEEVDYDLWIRNGTTSFNFGTGQDSKGNQVAYLADCSTPFTGATLPDGIWFWRVRAHDPTCNWTAGDWSEICYFTVNPICCFTVDITVPDVPTPVSPADWYITNDITPTFTWEQVVVSPSSDNVNNSDYCNEVYYLIQLGMDDDVVNRNESEEVFDETIDYSNDPRDSHDVYHPEMFQVLDDRMTFTPTILPGIGAGKTFYWRVKARDCVGNESAWSEIRAIRIDPHCDCLPGLVSPDDGTYTNDPTPFFDWSDEGSAYRDEGWDEETGPSYHIQVDNNLDFSSPEVNEWVDVSNYVPPMPLRDGTYYWRAGGIDEAGNCIGRTNWFDVWEIHIDNEAGGCLGKCSHVRRLVTPADGQCINDATPIFDWDPIGGLSDPIVYTLQVSDDPKFSDPLEINISEIPFEPLMKFQVIGVPNIQNMANTRWPIDQDGDGRFNITEADYEAYNGQLGGRFDGNMAGLNALPEGIYYWRVKAFDMATNSTHWTTPNKFEVVLRAPATPTLIRPAKVSQVVNDQTPTPLIDSPSTFEWVAVPDATHYIFQIDQDPNFCSPDVNVKVPDQGQATLHYLLPSEHAVIMEGIYYWRVSAVDCGGNESAWSEIRDDQGVRIGPLRCNPPFLVSPKDETITDNTRPTFDWTDIAAEAIYRFQLDNNIDFSSPEIDMPDLVMSNFIPDGSLQDGTYYWRVMAICSQDTTWSNIFTLIVNVSPPIMPTCSSPPDGSIFNNDTPTLDWDAPEGYGLRCQLQIDDDHDFSSPILDIGDFELTQYTIIPALPEGTYYWRVRAIDSAGSTSGWSHKSGYWRFTIDTTAPDAPTPSLSANYHLTPTMTWKQVVDSRSYQWPNLWPSHSNISEYCDEVYYLIQIETDGILEDSRSNTREIFDEAVEYSNDPRDPPDVYHPEMFQLLNGEVSFRPAALPNIDAGKTLYWRVKAIDCAGNESVWSRIHPPRIDLGGCTSGCIPDLISPDDGIYLNDPKPSFDWADVESLGIKIIYHLQVDNNVDFASPEIDEWVENSSYILSRALRDGTYYWQVVAIEESGSHKISWSTDIWELHIDAVFDDYFPPEPPQPVTPAPAQCINDATPIFDWTLMGDPLAPIIYTLQVSDNPDFSEPLEIVAEVPFEPLMEFRVREVFWPPNIANTRWPIDQNGDGRFNITETDYEAYNGHFGGRFDGKMAGLNALPEGTYYWRVKAFDQATNETIWSPAARFEVDIHETITEAELLHQKVPIETMLYQSYPNPTNSNCWIPFALSEKARVRIEIYNLAGRLIKVLEPGELEPGSYLTRNWAVPWDGCDQEGKEVASGIYFYRFQAGSLVKTRKLIILK